MTYISFISDEHLMKCIEELFEVYKECHKEMTSEQFYERKIDPLKFHFDIAFNEISVEDYLLTEITRQNDKKISGAIGKFHENLIGGIEGFKTLPIGNGHDIENDSKTIFAEIKNKHNTVKGEDKPGIHNKLKKLAEINPEATCYYVRIIDLKSQDRVWEFTSKEVKYSHPRVRIISGDRFYEVVTKKRNSFKELCEALPKAIKDFLDKKGVVIQKSTQTNVYKKIIENAKDNQRDILEQIFFDNFPTYNGYAGSIFDILPEMPKDKQ